MAVVDISTITKQEFNRLNKAYKISARKLDPDQEIFAPDLKDVKPKSIEEFLYIMVSADGTPTGYASGIISTSPNKYSHLEHRLALDRQQYIRYDSSFSEMPGNTTIDANNLWVFIDQIKMLKEWERYAQELIEHLKAKYPKTQILYVPNGEKDESRIKKLGFKDIGWGIKEAPSIIEGIDRTPRTPILFLYTP